MMYLTEEQKIKSAQLKAFKSIMGARCIPNWEIPKIIGIDASTWCRRQKNGFLNLSVYELNRLNLTDKEIIEIVKGELYE
jgi:hypothetical protein